MVDYIVVGKIGATFGIKGWLKIRSFTEQPAHILQYEPWYVVAENGQWEMIAIEQKQQQGKGIIAKFSGFDSPETARKLTGKEIAIKREQLAPLPPDEYYWTDLIGLMVIDQQGKTLGQVQYLMATGANDVIVIRDQAGKEHALPYLPGRVIKKIDLQQGVIYVDWEVI